jgi:hypothetical protein
MIPEQRETDHDGLPSRMQTGTVVFKAKVVVVR